jgi:glycosyltransferase involved in cell wall biosynthesis
VKYYSFHTYEQELMKRISLPQDFPYVLVMHDILLEKVATLVPPERMICFVPDNGREEPARAEILRKARDVVTCSEHSRTLLEKWLGRDVWVMHYVPVLEYFLPATSPPRVPYQVLYVGRLSPHKRLDIFTGACQRLPGEIQMVISSRMNSTPRAIGEHEKFRMMLSSRVGVVPSDFEGFSLVPGELAVAGTIPVLSDIPTHREIYPDFPIFRQGDVEDCGRVIMQALRGEFDGAIDTRRAFVKSRYGMDVVVQRVNSYLRSIT